MDTVRTGADISLEDAQALLNTFTLASGEGFIAINTKNLIVLASPLLEAMWGYEPGELVGKPVQILMPLRYRKDHTAGVRRFVMEDKQATSGHWSEVEALHKNGSEFLIHIRIMRVQHEGRFLLAAAVRSAVPYQRARMAVEEALELVQQNSEPAALVGYLQQALEAIEQLNLAKD
jgi:PAS domain S-box-containing protein